MLTVAMDKEEAGGEGGRSEKLPRSFQYFPDIIGVVLEVLTHLA